jgi:hypothetical protein
MKYLVILFILFATNCEKRVTNRASEDKPNRRLEDVLKSLALTKSWSLSFGSRNGWFSQQDSDTSLIVSGDGSVNLIEYGYTVREYKGRFQTDEEGAIRLTLEDYGHPWPEMYLREVSGEFYLYRKDGSTGFHADKRDASYESSDMPDFWPFRLTKAEWLAKPFSPPKIVDPEE